MFKMINTNIPQGYKQTELGIIPEDWEVKLFSQIFDMYPNNTYPRDCMNDSRGVVRNIHYGDVLIKYPTIVDVEKCAIPYLNENVKIKLQKLVQSGDIIIADTAEDETVGKCVEIKNVGDNKIVAGLHTFFCRPTAPFAAGWLGYYINSTNYHNQLIPYITGIKVSSISRTSIQETKLLVPPIAEQRAIAEALSDVDGLIAALDKKIAKKRLLKQGAMQQLLTGKKRLPGFTDEWIEKKLGKMSHIKTGSRNGDQAVENGKYPFFVRSQKVYAIDTYSFDGEAILVPGEGGIGNIFHYINGKFDFHQRVYKISDFADEACGKFIYFYTSRYFGEYALSLTVKATVDSLRLPTFEEFVICMPSDIEEQQAIATILSDMDKEISDLEAQRDKYRLLKSGMMQKLLTGQIRLKTE
ncbi:MAG: restriction endonuclease subunit S [Alistipes sp.]|nr:restriction endonuclease subunit S [Alistipes sp.]